MLSGKGKNISGISAQNFSLELRPSDFPIFCIRFIIDVSGRMNITGAAKHQETSGERQAQKGDSSLSPFEL